MPELILGTRNHKKSLELVELLAPCGFQLRSLADLPDAIEVAETGDTFEANARLKACEQARHLGRWVLGEDSGLAVEALDGAPGVYSARFSGSDASDDANNRLLLERLGETPLNRRWGFYVCHAVLADPSGAVRAEARGECHGRIRFAASGTAGFGYDPLFEVVEYHRTFGELGPVTKACLSHRARAIRALLPQMLQLVDADDWR